LQIKPENRFWIYIYGFAALIMLAALGVFAWLVFVSKSEPGVGRVAGPVRSAAAASSLPDEQYELLAQFPPPPYTPDRHAPQAFQTAMAFYNVQDYSHAGAALRDFLRTQPDLVAARFYLGVSLLLSGDRIAGIQELRDLTEAGDGPYLERARFYLAKGLIAEHDLGRAREQLENLISGHGALETQAAALLSQIRAS
jgi:TolA-binding protein